MNTTCVAFGLLGPGGGPLHPLRISPEPIWDRDNAPHIFAHPLDGALMFTILAKGHSTLAVRLALLLLQ